MVKYTEKNNDKKTDKKSDKSNKNQKKLNEKAVAPQKPLAPLKTDSTPKPMVIDKNTKSSLESTTDEEVYLTDAEGRRYCRAPDCDQISVVDGYCRFHYLFFWKKIQNRKKIIADGKLDRYIEELTARYTDKHIEMLRKDLRTEKDFMIAIQELELDDATQAGEEDDKSYLEEIRGMTDDSGARADDDY